VPYSTDNCSMKHFSVSLFLYHAYRTDLPKYCVSENGIVTKKTGDLMAYPMDDYASFYIGCSFSFEEALTDAGIQLQNVVKNCNVSMFVTNIPSVPVGPFATPMVVSMQPIPKDLVEKTVIITAAYEAVHGAPIHIGDPSVIGIEDIYATNYGEPSDIGDLIPVFWACGMTSSLAVRSASESDLKKYKRCLLSQSMVFQGFKLISNFFSMLSVVDPQKVLSEIGLKAGRCTVTKPLGGTPV